MDECLHMVPLQRPTAAELVARLTDSFFALPPNQFDIIPPFFPVELNMNVLDENKERSIADQRTTERSGYRDLCGLLMRHE